VFLFVSKHETRTPLLPLCGSIGDSRDRAAVELEPLRVRLTHQPGQPTKGRRGRERQ